MLSNKMGEANSILFRKAFHHEYESQLRKRKGEHLVITRPKLSIIVSGTPAHIKGLFRGNEDGLFSRFMIVTGNSSLRWESARPTPGKQSLDERFSELGKEFTSLSDHFKRRKLEIQFQGYQWDKIDSIGEDYMLQAFEEAGEYATSIAKRHMNMLCRIAATLTAVRHFESQSSAEVVYCSGVNFESALWMVDQSFQNSLKVFKTLGKYTKGNSKREAFLNALPEIFTIKGVESIYTDLKISYRSAGRYVQVLIDLGLLESISYGVYRKIPSQN